MKSVSLKIVWRWRTNHFSAMTCFGTVDHNRLHSHPASSLKHSSTTTTHSHTHTHACSQTVQLFFLVSALICCGLTTHTATKTSSTCETHQPNLLFNFKTAFVLRCYRQDKITNILRINPKVFLVKEKIRYIGSLLSYLHEISIILCFHKCCRKRTGDVHFH